MRLINLKHSGWVSGNMILITPEGCLTEEYAFPTEQWLIHCLWLFILGLQRTTCEERNQKTFNKFINTNSSPRQVLRNTGNIGRKKFPNKCVLSVRNLFVQKNNFKWLNKFLEQEIRQTNEWRSRLTLQWFLARTRLLTVTTMRFLSHNDYQRSTHNCYPGRKTPSSYSTVEEQHTPSTELRDSWNAAWSTSYKNPLLGDTCDEYPQWLVNSCTEEITTRA